MKSSLFLLCLLALTGCSNQSSLVVIDAGRVDVQEVRDSSFAARRAALMLSEALSKKPSATVFEVNYQVGYPSGNVYSMHITYDRTAHTVYENEVEATSGGIKFSEVSDAMIKEVANRCHEILDVGTMGATPITQ